jgi:hypothetical protein
MKWAGLKKMAESSFAWISVVVKRGSRENLIVKIATLESCLLL